VEKFKGELYYQEEKTLSLKSKFLFLRKAFKNKTICCKEKKDIWRSWVKRISTQAYPRPRRSTPKSRPSLSMRRKHLKISVKENKYTRCAFNIEDQTFKSRPSLSARRTHLKITGEENKHSKCAIDPKGQIVKSKIDFQVKNQPLKTEIISSFVTNIKDCTKFFNTIQILFVHKGIPYPYPSNVHMYLLI